MFTGDPEGNFFALDARTGNKLWSFQTGAGHRGASISYSVGGRQYIAVTTGFQQTVVGSAIHRLIPQRELSCLIHVGRVRVAGGIAMKHALLSIRARPRLSLTGLPRISSSKAKRFSANPARLDTVTELAGPMAARPGWPRVDLIKPSSRILSPRGAPGTGNAGVRNGSFHRADLNAVVAYVASLNGVTTLVNSERSGIRGRNQGFQANSARGRELFSDAVRSHGRCSTYHEVGVDRHT